MSKIKIYSKAALILLLAVGCVRQPILEIPQVEFSFLWNKIRSKAAADIHTAQNMRIYIYPQFDYYAEPIVLDYNGVATKAKLMPGKYKVLMHNQNIEPIVAENTESYDAMSLRVPEATAGRISFVTPVVGLDKNDEMHDIEVKAAAEGANKFVFTPVTISKNIRFVINTEKFGEVKSATATLSGVSSSMKLSTWERVAKSTMDVGEWSVDGARLSSTPVELLGVSSEQKVELTLFVTNTTTPRPLEQPIDLTDAMNNIVGDEIEITIDVEFKPDVRIHTVTIRQWLAGNAIDIDLL